MNEYTPTLAECEQDEFDHKVNELVQDWSDQLEESEVITRDAPYGQDSVTEQDLIDWAKQDGVYYPYNVHFFLPVLEHHARQHLEELAQPGDWRGLGRA